MKTRKIMKEAFYKGELIQNALESVEKAKRTLDEAKERIREAVGETFLFTRLDSHSMDLDDTLDDIRDLLNGMGEDEYATPVSESKKRFGGKVLKFVDESSYESLREFYDWLKVNTELDSGITVKYNDNDNGREILKMIFDDRYQWDDDVVDGIKSKDEDEGIMDWLRVFQRKTTKNHWSLDIDEDDATDEYIITVNKRAPKEDMYAETSDEGRWSGYGEFLGQLPMDCIMDCSHSGKCDSEVEYWTDQLAFADGLPLDKAIEFVAEYGAWDREELSQKSSEEISQIVLWIFCGNLKEEAYQFMRDGDSEDWPELGDWDDKDWRRFQEEQCCLGLNN